MCGIGAVVVAAPSASGEAGDAASHPSVPGPQVVDRALAALAGRGPDGGAADVAPGVVLLATRLIQWDEGSPRQPFVTGAGDRAVFNGELFNLSALQQQVGLPGAPEIAVLLEGLRRWGPDFLRRVDGQFAVVVRLADGTTYAARDRFGIVPLYRAALHDDPAAAPGTPTGWVFASSIAAVLELLARRPAYDVDGLATILRDWAPTGASSPYLGVAQVEPGHVVVVDPAGRTCVRRWAGEDAECAAPSRPAPRDPAASAAHTHSATLVSSGRRGPGEVALLEGRLRAAVRVRMRSVHEVACLVSGGIDSTVLAAVAAEEGARLGLGLCLEGDEETTRRQRAVAEAVGLELVQHRLTPAETMATFREYVRTRRMPLVRLGPVGMTALARRARAEGVRTVLSGEGADEVFCGYDSYRLVAARAGLFGAVDGLDWERFGAPEVCLGKGRRWARAYWRGLVALGSAPPSRVGILRPVAGLFGPVLAQAYAAASAPAGSAVPAGTDLGEVRGGAVSTLLGRRREEDLSTLLAAYLLVVQGDQAWMEEGVELRPPYLSAVVADWAFARDPAGFVSIERGKEPIYALLTRLAERRPALAALGFAKAAFRVDARFLLGDDAAYDDLRAAVAACPSELVDAPTLLTRLDRARDAGTLSEAESMLTTLAASFGILAGG